MNRTHPAPSRTCLPNQVAKLSTLLQPEAVLDQERAVAKPLGGLSEKLQAVVRG
jgi:hypothetical protein